MARPKNILLILTDQQSWHMMSGAGNRYLSTPAMDSLAERGVRFDLAFCANPVCMPSRFSMFTGRYPTEIGQRMNIPDPEPLPGPIVETGMGHAIKTAGYEVTYAGKEHITGTNAVELGFNSICSNSRDELAQACASYLRQPHDRPFFLTSCFINPHDICLMAIREHPGAPAEEAILEQAGVALVEVEKALALADEIPEDEFWSARCPPLPGNHEPQENEPDAIGRFLDQRPFKRHARDHWDEKKWRMHRWVYHRLTEWVDAQIGIVLDALHESGLEEDTVVIFSSDHGDHSSSHKMEHKTSLYEEATRVPLIICDPDGPRGALNQEHLVCNGIDFYPTICDYAGTDRPDHLTGLSLRPVARGGSPATWRDHVLIESELGYGIRTKDLFYVLYDEGANREQLYDLKKDPGQTRNFIHDAGYEKDLATLRGQIKGYLQER